VNRVKRSKVFFLCAKLLAAAEPTTNLPTHTHTKKHSSVVHEKRTTYMHSFPLIFYTVPSFSKSPSSLLFSLSLGFPVLSLSLSQYSMLVGLTCDQYFDKCVQQEKQVFPVNPQSNKKDICMVSWMV